MATPLGHYFVGLSLAQLFASDRAESRRGLWLAAIACVPDLDFLPGLFVGNLSQFHHGASHSFAAAAIFAAGSLSVLRFIGWRQSLKLALLSFLLYGSHVVIDFFTVDRGTPYGVPLFWPWSHETYQSAWPLLPHVQHTRSPIVSVHNFLLMMREIVIFIPLVGLVCMLKRWSRPSARAAWLYASWFIIAASASMLSLQIAK
jgi:inner membrane protein